MVLFVFYSDELDRFNSWGSDFGHGTRIRLDYCLDNFTDRFLAPMARRSIKTYARHRSLGLVDTANVHRYRNNLSYLLVG